MQFLSFGMGVLWIWEWVYEFMPCWCINFFIKIISFDKHRRMGVLWILFLLPSVCVWSIFGIMFTFWVIWLRVSWNFVAEQIYWYCHGLSRPTLVSDWVGLHSCNWFIFNEILAWAFDQFLWYWKLEFLNHFVVVSLKRKKLVRVLLFWIDWLLWEALNSRTYFTNISAIFTRMEKVVAIIVLSHTIA